jgi:hypothetical protein
MQAASPAAIGCCVFASLFSIQAAAFSQDRLTSGDQTQRNEQAIELALSKHGSVDFAETPLREVMAEIGRQFQIPIVLSIKKLEEASVSADTPITIKLDSLSLESILRLMLAQAELDFTIRDEVLLITTPQDVESQLDMRTYPVLDLVYSRSSTSKAFVGADYDSLIEIITTTIKPDSWDDVGGPGAIDALGNAGSLVVSQTQAIHRQIERLLSSLRRAKAMQGISSLPVPAVVSRQLEPIEIHSAPHSTSAETTWQLPRVHD